MFTLCLLYFCIYRSQLIRNGILFPVSTVTTIWPLCCSSRRKVIPLGWKTQNFSLSSRQTLASEIEIIDVLSETWKTRTATGAPPPGLYDGACTVVSETLYHFGGTDSHSWYNTLHCLDTLSLNWRELHGHAQSPADQPMPKTGCGLVTYTDTASLTLFAGYGIPRHPAQTGAQFVHSTNYPGRGWTNELHLFNLTNGM